MAASEGAEVTSPFLGPSLGPASLHKVDLARLMPKFKVAVQFPPNSTVFIVTFEDDAANPRLAQGPLETKIREMYGASSSGKKGKILSIEML